MAARVGQTLSLVHVVHEHWRSVSGPLTDILRFDRVAHSTNIWNAKLVLCQCSSVQKLGLTVSFTIFCIMLFLTYPLQNLTWGWLKKSKLCLCQSLDNEEHADNWENIAQQTLRQGSKEMAQKLLLKGVILWQLQLKIHVERKNTFITIHFSIRQEASSNEDHDKVTLQSWMILFLIAIWSYLIGCNNSSFIIKRGQNHFKRRFSRIIV